jgi:hypothetical protein
MNYGLSRAVPMSIFGFLCGMLLTIFLRTVQGLAPNWDPQVSIVLGAIVSTVFFVWGMGAFDPSMSVHGGEEHGDEHGEESHAEAHAALPAKIEDAHAAAPHQSRLVRLSDALQRLSVNIVHFIGSGHPIGRIFKFIILIIPLILCAIFVGVLRFLSFVRNMGGDIFLVTTIVLVILLFIAILALLPGGPSIHITNDPVGAPTGNGYVTINLFGSDYIFSKLSLFAIFFVWTIVSLALAGGGIALLMSFLAREVRSVKGKAPAPEALVPPAPLRLFSRGATWLLSRLPEPPKPQR